MADEKTSESTSGAQPEAGPPNVGIAPGEDAQKRDLGETIEAGASGNQSLIGAEGEEKAPKPATPAPDQDHEEEAGESDPSKRGTETREARAPEEYAEFKMPEGATMDEAALTQFKSFAKEQDLTQEQAQKILEFGGGQLKERLEAPYKAWNETQEKWQTEVKADPEIGGTKLEQSIKNAGLVFEPGESNPFVKTAGEAQALRAALNTTGSGNNPAVVKLFVRMGRMLAEPGPLSGNPVRDKQGDLLAKMYPMMNEGSS